MRKHSKEYLENLTPYKCYEILVEGNKRFVNNLNADHDHLEMINETREGQYPFAVILSCMDSRTSVELIFDQGLGDLFSIRVAGNIVNNDILASIEYAVKYVGSKILVVLGHTECGAIKSAKQGVKDGHITDLLKRIQPSISKAMLKDDKEHLFHDNVAYANVENSLEEILTRSEIVKQMFEKGEIGLVGGIYNIENGEVDFFKNLTKKKKGDKQLTNV
ncbi:MAG TPA: carbonic anhydrase [Chitinophagaceae bacterium]|nr:carbonic anhydrase [Chitinophagaceae bacterium]HNU13027.1 carbonic anhydrase [Chitinophagaceae bacterium]